MKFLPTKQYRIVPGCGLLYETFSTNWPKFTAHENFPPEKYPLYGTSIATRGSLKRGGAFAP